MSLRYDLSKCGVVSFEALTNPEDGSWSTTQSLIFETIAVGLGKITEKNLVEFKARSDFWRKLNGIDVIPLEEIRKRIGLSCNVIDESWAKFVKRHADGFKRDVSWVAAEAKRKLEDREVSNA
jgi:hypothetical protein